ncbi:MAG: hypothetical protein RL618_1024, partial [Pseudomonadota bacterium]
RFSAISAVSEMEKKAEVQVSTASDSNCTHKGTESMN